MFIRCSSLTSAPELSAITLESMCCQSMFNSCSSLSSAPLILPATTLATSCYKYMFQDCISLTRAPELPAASLVSACYGGMFQRCRNLTYIKALFTTAPSTTYTSSWVEGVASAGTFVKKSNATWNVTGVNGVPNGWTIQRA